jgi:hypothetical protein
LDFAGDEHIRFTCENLHQYDRILAEQKALHPDIPEREIKDRMCNEYNTAVWLGFDASEYTTPGEELYGMNKVTESSSEYDWESIMHYSSDQGATRECYTPTRGFFKNVKKCPLSRKIGTAWNGEDVMVPIRQNKKPSPLDVEWVKSHYPWRDNPDD